MLFAQYRAPDGGAEVAATLRFSLAKNSPQQLAANLHCDRLSERRPGGAAAVKRLQRPRLETIATSHRLLLEPRRLTRTIRTGGFSCFLFGFVSMLQVAPLLFKSAYFPKNLLCKKHPQVLLQTPALTEIYWNSHLAERGQKNDKDTKLGEFASMPFVTSQRGGAPHWSDAVVDVDVDFC